MTHLIQIFELAYVHGLRAPLQHVDLNAPCETEQFSKRIYVMYKTYFSVQK